jgi:hypothetical protein
MVLYFFDRNLQMDSGICLQKSHLSNDLLAQFLLRRDKILFKPEVIKNWAVVIFETKRFFNEDTANAMVRGFIDGARSLGKYLIGRFLRLINEYH